MPDIGAILVIILVILAILLVVSLVFRLIKVAIVIAALVIFVPIICTIMWGDGTDYVSKFASIFTPDIEEGISDGYEAYRDEYSKNPVVDMDQVEEYFNQAGKWAGDTIGDAVFPKK